MTDDKIKGFEQVDQYFELLEGTGLRDEIPPEVNESWEDVKGFTKMILHKKGLNSSDSQFDYQSFREDLPGVTRDLLSDYNPSIIRRALETTWNVVGKPALIAASGYLSGTQYYQMNSTSDPSMDLLTAGMSLAVGLFVSGVAGWLLYSEDEDFEKLNETYKFAVKNAETISSYSRMVGD